MIGKGCYGRKSDRKTIKRYLCHNCHRTFSGATQSAAWGQNKRQFNQKIFRMLCSSMSMRRIAKELKIARRTVERKKVFMAQLCALKNNRFCEIFKCENQNFLIQFDELETSIHSKCKPVSVAIAVGAKKRKILGFEISIMPAKGKIAKKARKKYGYRPDQRPAGLNRLFFKIKPTVTLETEFCSDMNLMYRPILKNHFPNTTYIQHKSKGGCVTGQGELKKVEFDPIFSLNHTLAMMRANINRLVRRTWCTSKTIQGLREHLHLYMHYHNEYLTPA